MNSIRDQVFAATFERWEGMVDGELVNNRLNVGNLEHNYLLRPMIIRNLGHLAAQDAPDFVAAVPGDTSWIAEQVSEAFGMEVVSLAKDSDTGTIDFKTVADRELCESLETGVLLAGVFNKFTDTRKVLRMFAMRRRILSAYAVWDRKFDRDRIPLGIPHRALFHWPIPDMLPDDAWQWDRIKSD